MQASRSTAHLAVRPARRMPLVLLNGELAGEATAFARASARLRPQRDERSEPRLTRCLGDEDDGGLVLLSEAEQPREERHGQGAPGAEVEGEEPERSRARQ